MTGTGRFLSFTAFWADPLHRTNMLQCDRQESANSGRFDKQARAWSDSRKQPFAFANVAVGIAPKETFLRKKRGACDPPGR